MIKFLKQFGEFLSIITELYRKWKDREVEKAVEKGAKETETEIGASTAGKPSRYSGHDGVRTIRDEKKD